MPTYLPKFNLKNLDKSGATNGYAVVWSDALGQWIPSATGGSVSYTIDGGSASSTYWGLTADGGAATSTYPFYAVLDGGGASG